MEQPERPIAFDEQMYLEILREDPPMKRYVSRGDTKDEIDIEGPHREADQAIFRIIRFVMDDSTPRFQPVLGGAGMGKTHLFWALKDRETSLKKGKFTAVYVPSPPAPVRVPLHFHACIVDELGEEIFENAIDMLITKFGGVKGVTHELYDYTYALERLLVEYPGITADVVKVLLRYRLDPANRDIARRWLLGDALSQDEIARLDVRTILEEDDVTLATLKLLLEGSEQPLVLFIDEMEGPYRSHGEEGEIQFLEVIKRLYNEGRNAVIVASCLEDIWERIYNLADGPMRSRMEPPVRLREFTKDDITEFITTSMKLYWDMQNVDPPPNLLFPLTEADIEEAFAHSKGVPREALRFLIPRIEQILFEKEPEPVEEQPDFVIKLTASVVINALSKALEETGKQIGVTTQLLVAKGVAEREATAILSLSKGDDSKRICIDVANVKDWDRSGGVSAYYSVKRLHDILERGEADHAMIAVPEATGGAKYTAMTEDLGNKLTVLKFNEQSARNLVEAVTTERFDEESLQSFRQLLEGLFT